MASDQEDDSTKCAWRISEEFIGNNWNTFRSYLEKSVVVKNLVGHFGLFTREQRHKLLQLTKSDPTEATKCAFDTIEEMDNSNKYTSLLETLDKAGYPKLVGLLTGNFVKANDNHRKRFNEATSIIYERLNPSEAVPYLLEKGVISFNEAAEIRHIETNRSRSEAALELQYLLPNRHRHWYQLTIRSLVESRQLELAKQIDPEMVKTFLASDESVSSLCSEISLESRLNLDSEQGRLRRKGLEKFNQTPEMFELGLMVTKIEETKHCLGVLLQKTNTDRSKLHSVQESCRKEIRNLRTDLNDLLDTLEESLFTSTSGPARRQTRQPADTLSSNQSSIGSLSQWCFDKFDTPNEMLFESLVRYSTIDINNIIQNRKVVVGLDDDKLRSHITGCTILTNGELVLCDYTNKKVKVLDISWKLRDYIILPSEPFGVSVADNETVIVTMPDKCQLRFLRVLPDLKHDEEISLDKQCWGIDVFENELYVSCCCPFKRDDGEVRVMDFKGNLKRSIGIYQNGTFMFSRPDYLTINPVSRKLYVSDRGVSETLYCLTLDGEFVYAYPTHDEDWNGGFGVYIDSNDNVLLFSGIDLRVITQSGANRIIITVGTLDNTKPLCMAVRERDGVIVICGESKHLSILTIKTWEKVMV